MSIDEKEFAVPFFHENGFRRKQCVACKSYFWTQQPDRRTCGDQPCEPYSFIGKPPTRGRYSVPEIRRTFIDFFDKNGHTPIKPYPVVARWRDDVYLVGASIYDFQPFVTEGTILPPANPLVVSQPCLRFTDIDNVGPTMGRHLLIFEMGGAHAFNYPDKQLYWKNETIQYHHRLLTESLGVKSERVTYKEHFWSGGGNAGPDVEACVNGLEISTLVFMQYKVVNGEMQPLPIKTVDTGYGIERWAWLSQGTANGFEPVYGDVYAKVLRLANVRADNDLLARVLNFSGYMDVEKTGDRVEARKTVAKHVGMDWQKLDSALTPIEAAYAVLDHTKAIAFLLAEGVVPSNVQEGYLTRLLIRRTCRMLRLLGIEDKLTDIVNLQIEEWGPDFPHLKRMRNEIAEALKVEQSKYQRTLERGNELVRKIAADLRSQGKQEVPLETLIELYDSHGLVPEIVRDVAEKEHLRVNAPGNFLGQVAKRHMTASKLEEPYLVKKLKETVSGIAPTDLLYYKDAYAREFESEVVKVVDGKYVVLRATAFYAEGGGQPPDIGAIETKDGVAKVVDVQKVGNVVIHEIEGKPPSAGERVKGKIDWDRRSSLMRHHTATHILLGAARRVLGEHAWQAGAQKGVESSRVDVSHYDRITDEQVREIERLATEVVLANIPIESMWLPRERAEQLYGFGLYQGGVVPGREIRVVKIGDWDVEADGGTHCRSTGEMGLIKVLKTERVQDGVERIIFAAGTQALRALQERESLLVNTAEIVNAPVEKTADYVRALIEEKAMLERRLREAIARLAATDAKALMDSAVNVGPVKLVTARRTEGDEKELIALSQQVTETELSAVFVGVLALKSARLIIAAGTLAQQSGVHAGKVARELAKYIGGGGGGESYFGQAGGPNVAGVDELIREAPKIIERIIRKG